MAVLKLPVVLFKSAAVPMAVFWAPSPVLLISDIEKERSRTHSGVLAPVSVTPERKPAHCSVPHAGGEVKKSVLPLRRVEARIAAVWGLGQPLAAGVQSQTRQAQRRMKTVMALLF